MEEQAATSEPRVPDDHRDDGVAAWRTLDPKDAPRSVWGGETSDLKSYKVRGKWHRDPLSGHWAREYRIELQDGRVAAGYEFSPAQTWNSEEGLFGVLALVAGAAIGLAVGAAFLVSGGPPLAAVGGTVVGMAGVAAGVKLDSISFGAVKRFEAPGNLVWRHGATVRKVSSAISLALPGVLVAAVSIALAG